MNKNIVYNIKYKYKSKYYAIHVSLKTTNTSEQFQNIHKLIFNVYTNFRKCSIEKRCKLTRQQLKYFFQSTCVL